MPFQSIIIPVLPKTSSTDNNRPPQIKSQIEHEHDKELRKKLRNRESALAARERKKQRLIELETKVSSLEPEVEKLRSEKNILKQSLYRLMKKFNPHLESVTIWQEIEKVLLDEITQYQIKLRVSRTEKKESIENIESKSESSESDNLKSDSVKAEIDDNMLPPTPMPQKYSNNNPESTNKSTQKNNPIKYDPDEIEIIRVDPCQSDAIKREFKIDEAEFEAELRKLYGKKVIKTESEEEVISTKKLKTEPIVKKEKLVVKRECRVFKKSKTVIISEKPLHPKVVTIRSRKRRGARVITTQGERSLTNESNPLGELKTGNSVKLDEVQTSKISKIKPQICTRQNLQKPVSPSLSESSAHSSGYSTNSSRRNSGNKEARNLETKSQTRNSQTRNSETRNSQTKNSQIRHSETRKSETINSGQNSEIPNGRCYNPQQTTPTPSPPHFRQNVINYAHNIPPSTQQYYQNPSTQNYQNPPVYPNYQVQHSHPGQINQYSQIPRNYVHNNNMQNNSTSMPNNHQSTTNSPMLNRIPQVQIETTSLYPTLATELASNSAQIPNNQIPNNQISDNQISNNRIRNSQITSNLIPNRQKPNNQVQNCQRQNHPIQNHQVQNHQSQINPSSNNQHLSNSTTSSSQCHLPSIQSFQTEPIELITFDSITDNSTGNNSSRDESSFESGNNFDFSSQDGPIYIPSSSATSQLHEEILIEDPFDNCDFSLDDVLMSIAD